MTCKDVAPFRGTGAAAAGAATSAAKGVEDCGLVHLWRSAGAIRCHSGRNRSRIYCHWHCGRLVGCVVYGLVRWRSDGGQRLCGFAVALRALGPQAWRRLRLRALSSAVAQLLLLVVEAKPRKGRSVECCRTTSSLVVPWVHLTASLFLFFCRDEVFLKSLCWCSMTLFMFPSFLFSY